MTKPSQQHREGSTTLILVEFYSIPRRRNSCQPSARGKFVFSISLSSRFGLCNLCVYLDWRICRTITSRDILSEKINFFVQHGDDHTLAWVSRGMEGVREYKNHSTAQAISTSLTSEEPSICVIQKRTVF